MATNQQVQPKGRQAQPGRPKLADIKSAERPKPSPDAKPKKKGGVKLLVILVLVLVLAGGGFFGYRHWRHPAKGQSGAGKPAGAAVSGPQATYTLKEITVNLADANSSHFLRIGVVLQYPQSNAALAAELRNQEYIMDDRIISDLRVKTYGDLSTDQGEKDLKQELLQTVNGILAKGRVSGVYFGEFLIQ